MPLKIQKNLSLLIHFAIISKVLYIATIYNLTIITGDFLGSKSSMLASLTTVVDGKIRNTPNDSIDQSCSMDTFAIPLRNRTTISKSQAKILQEVFEANQFPDSELKKKLQERTGLSTRVIQVWFQNRRREKKMNTKHIEVEVM